MSKENIKEDASAGSVGAGAIAVNMGRQGVTPTRRPTGDGVGSHRKADHDLRAHHAADKEQRAKDQAHRAHAQDQLAKARELKAAREKANKKRSFADFFRKRVNEEFDLGSVVANLKGVENAGKDQVSDVVSYGIEDDKGNFMRVTVKSDQAKEFEMTIARKMADNKDSTALGMSLPKTSLAEILFDLQNTFDIVDVEFPIIPKDAVYNAGDATVGQAPTPAGDTNSATGDDMGGFGGDLDAGGLDGGMGDDATGMGGTAGGAAAGGLGADTGAAGGAGGLGGDNEVSDFEQGSTQTDTDMGELDGGNVQDFGADTSTSSDPASLLQSLVDMLKKQAEAETAKANAAAEQARASQAEWSALAADKEVERAEELARMQATVEEKKRREKMAKQYADMAKYNVSQGREAVNRSSANNFGESVDTSLLYSMILEDEYDNTNALQKAKQQIVQKYQINPNDDAATKTYKAAAQRLELQGIDLRIQLLQLTQQYQAQQNQNNQQQNQQQQGQQQQQNAQNNAAAQPAANGSTPGNGGAAQTGGATGANNGGI